MNNPQQIETLLRQLKTHPVSDGWFFSGDKILVKSQSKDSILPLQDTVDDLAINILDVCVDNNKLILNCEIGATDEQLLDKGYVTYNVKKFLPELNSEAQSQILRAYHWRNWHSQAKFCGTCGSGLENKIDSAEKKCSTCKTSVFPRFSPAVMVLIQKEDKILLARSPHFQPGFYSAIAGFIDLGETAEQAAHREVKEELGLEITDLEYFSTQTWPFPDSFMIAFKAKYLRGELKPDEKEIEDARWFGAEDLPLLPPSASIAKQLIESVVKGLV